jgi:rhamnose transport system permease protein
MKDDMTKKRFGWWHEVVLAGLIVGLLLVMSRLEPGLLQWRNQLLLSRQLWEFAILALGMTCIIITGGIDLSIGSTMGLCAVAFGMVFDQTGSLTLAIAACLLTGVTAGTVNGVIIAYGRVHPLIITLATYAAYRGIAEGVSQGKSYSAFPSEFARLARGTILGLPIPGLLFVGLAIGMAIVLGWSRPGRVLYAMGHNELATRFAGICVERVKSLLYAASGGLAGLATLIYISRFDSAKADAGKGFELDVITAVVVGGASIFGGRGNVLGTVLGLILIHETRLLVGQHLRMEELKPIAIGMLLILSVLAYRCFARPVRE